MPVQNLELEEAQVIRGDKNVGRETNLLLKILFIIAVYLGLKDSPVIWIADSIHTPATDRSLVTTRHVIREKGSLTSVIVDLVTGSPNRQTYTKVTLEDENQNEVTLLAGRYTDITAPAHGEGSIPVIPGMRIRLDTWSSLGVAPTLRVRGTINKGIPRTGGWSPNFEGMTEGQGNIRSIAGTNPAANTEFSEVVATNSRLLMQSLKARLVTDANAGTREVTVNHGDGSTTISQNVSTTTQIVSLTRDYTWAEGMNPVTPSVSAVISSPMPKYLLDQAFTFGSQTFNIKAGDDWGAPTAFGEEYLVE